MLIVFDTRCWAAGVARFYCSNLAARVGSSGRLQAARCEGQQAAALKADGSVLAWGRSLLLQCVGSTARLQAADVQHRGLQH